MEDLFNELTIISLCGGLLALLLGALGVLLIVLYIRNKKKAQDSLDWSTVAGQIIRNDISMVTDEDDDSSKKTYIPKVEYEYSVGGQTFTGKRIAFGSVPGFNSHQKAVDFLKQYPVDCTITVYYNPQKPQEAVLTQKMRSMTVGLVIGIILLVIMFCILCFVLFGLIRSWL